MDISEKQNNTIRIRGVKVSNDDLLPNVNHHLPRNVFFSLVIGQPGSGKTTLWQNLLRKYYKNAFDKIYLFSGSKNTLPEDLLSKLHPKRVYDELDAKTLQGVYDKAKEKQESTLIILDDVIADITRSKELKSLVKKIAYNRRHARCYIMLISQKLREIPLNIRTVADSIYFFNFGNPKENRAFFDDFVGGLDKKEYAQLTKYLINHNTTGHSFLFLNRVGSERYYREFNELIFHREGESDSENE